MANREDWGAAKDAARADMERQLAGMSIPEDLKQKLRQNFEQALLQKETEMGAPSNDYFGAEKWDEAVQRYRDLGARTRAPVALDQRQADQARGLQMGALGLMDRAARGEAPSVAEAQGRLAGANIQRGAIAQTGGARGVGGAIAATNAAGRTMGDNLVGSLAGTTMARANEATQDRNAFAQGATGVRGQDIGAATTNAEMLAKSRAQDEARQQQFEKMGWNTRNAELQSNVELQRQEDAKKEELAKMRAAQANSEAGTAKTAASMGSAAMMSGALFFSDKRTKYELPMGSLAHMRGR